MEPAITPFNEISNPNQNLIYPEKPEELTSQEMFNVNQFFVENVDNKSSNKEKFIITFTCCRLIIILFSFIIFLPLIIIPSAIEDLKIGIKIIISISVIILLLILLIFSKNKLEITKDKVNKKAIIKVINFLCFTIKTIIMDLDNIYFYCEDIRPNQSTRLFIINNFKNLSGIDLEKSDIKSKPKKLYYYFNDIGAGKHGYYQLNIDLNNFVGATGENPLKFDIDTLIKK